MESGLYPHLSGRFESPVLPLPAAGNNIFVTVRHGKGRKPFSVKWTLVALGTDLGYSRGDELDLVSGYNTTVHPTTWQNEVECGFVFRGSVDTLNYHHKTTANLTALTSQAVNWGVRCRAEF